MLKIETISTTSTGPTAILLDYTARTVMLSGGSKWGNLTLLLMDQSYQILIFLLRVWKCEA